MKCPHCGSAIKYNILGLSLKKQFSCVACGQFYKMKTVWWRFLLIVLGISIVVNLFITIFVPGLRGLSVYVVVIASALAMSLSIRPSK